MSRNEIDALIEQNNVELEALRRDMGERRQRARFEENLAWAKAEAERQAQAEPTVTKSEAAMTDSTQVWETWIKDQIRTSRKASENLLSDCVGEALAGVEKKHKAALDELRAEVAALHRQVFELQAESKLGRALDDVQARLAKLETPPRLKAMG